VAAVAGDQLSGWISLLGRWAGIGCYPFSPTEISKFHIAGYQFAELKIKLMIDKLVYLIYFN